MEIRKATINDIDAVADIYERIHDAEECGEVVIGWERGVYPTRDTAMEALKREDLFVLEDNSKIVGTGILNKIQVDVYEGADWEYEADPEKVMVMHTLVIDPKENGKGYGKSFVQFYEKYALENGCPYLRMDTNEKNRVARNMYKGLGYKEIGIVSCVFNGMNDINLVLIENYLKLR